MTRQELEQYIDNNVLLGNVVTEDSEIYREISKSFFLLNMQNQLLGSVCVENIYVKKDKDNKIHLTYYAREDEEADLGNLIDIIDAESFVYSENLKVISGKSVTKIDYGAFSGLPLIKIDFPNVEEIELDAFACTKLQDVTLDKVRVLPSGAFARTPLREFKGNKVKVVGVGAFQWCRELKRLVLPRVEEIYLQNQANIITKEDIEILMPEDCKLIR